MSVIASFNAWYLTKNAYLLKSSENKFDINNIAWDQSILWYVCDVNSTFSCSTVFNHDFSWIFWIPFSLLALIVYPAILILAILAIKWKIKNVYKILLYIVAWWILFNGYIIVNEALVWVYCILCLICTLIIIAIWIISIYWLKEKN